MKNKIGICVLALLMLLGHNYICAEEDLDLDYQISTDDINKVEKSFNDNSEEIENALLTLKNDKNKISLNNYDGDIDFSSSYKVFQTSDNIAHIKDGTILDDVSDEFLINVPLDERTICYFDDSYELIGIAQHSLDEPIISMEYIDNTFSEFADGRNYDPVVLVESKMHYVTFALTKIGEEEYVIPYASRPDFLGLTNGVIYSSEDFIELIYNNSPYGISSDSDGGLPLSVIDEKENKAHQMNMLYFAGLSLVVIGSLMYWKVKNDQ